MLLQDQASPVDLKNHLRDSYAGKSPINRAIVEAESVTTFNQGDINRMSFRGIHSAVRLEEGEPKKSIND